MPTCHLDHRAILRVSGPEAEHFLQNIVTTDLAGLATGEALPGALLTPQGKILFDFLVSRAGPETFRLDCRADIAADFMRRLMLYRLRAKVEISQEDQPVVAVSWGSDSAAPEADWSVADRRFPEQLSVTRHYDDTPPATVGHAAWVALRIANAVAESGSDFALGDAFPHDVLYDQNGGVGLRKGCYVGQEVVSRMQHRGTARRRLLIATATAALPATGTELTVDGRTLGALGSVEGATGLAIARIDRVKDAMDAGKPILAGEVEVALAIPGWARFAFPESGGDEA
ncbi:folate-binding protein YgfZ [Nitratireductor sp. ZSWI3]|uniref:CAF17-like 4Fe-4S cluster assembly/insertion protein YgfZ n=1 Tax=Nitratireductor sp. ZSWI3 TaxID=2966359 RepID=UPI00214FC7EF|nr:folate-binding protein YgfZ [Nitratireductor sp. ZSWI3]MCR4266887.1 folate-binding protein YgfZ [Nitratireductor sp. ZSWI3]